MLVGWWISLNQDAGGRNDVSRAAYKVDAARYNRSACADVFGPVPSGFDE